MLLPKGLGADSPKIYITGERVVNGKRLPLTLAFNNPGGIKLGADWRGLVKSPDNKHCAFSTAVFGFRALAMVLRNYQRRHGIRTLLGVFERWAPSNSGEGNHPRDYAERVSDRTGLSVNEDLNLSDPAILAKMAAAMCEVESGKKNPFYRGDIEAGVAAALGKIEVEVSGEHVEFSVPPDPKPLYKSRTLTGTGIAGVFVAAKEYIPPEKAEDYAAFVPQGWWPYIIAGGIVTGLGLIVYARLDDWRKQSK